MKFYELTCSYMSLYAVPFFVWVAHKNFAVLVPSIFRLLVTLTNSFLKGLLEMLNVCRDCWMLAISTFVVGTTYIIQLVPTGILIFRLSSILNLHIYQGYTSLYDSLHDFITHYKLLLMRLMTRMKLSQRKTEKHGLEKIIGKPSF